MTPSRKRSRSRLPLVLIAILTCGLIAASPLVPPLEELVAQSPPKADAPTPPPFLPDLGPQRHILVSIDGADEYDCDRYNMEQATRTISKALHCAKPGETVLIKDGNYRESVHIEPPTPAKKKPLSLVPQKEVGGRLGKPVFLAGQGAYARLDAPDKHCALMIRVPFVSVKKLTIVGRTEIKGTAKEPLQGIRLAEAVLRGDLTGEHFGVPDADPDIAALDLEQVTVEGGLALSGRALRLYQVTTKGVGSLTGYRHVIHDSDIHEPLTTNVDELRMIGNRVYDALTNETGDRPFIFENRFGGPVRHGVPAKPPIRGMERYGNRYAVTVDMNTQGQKEYNNLLVGIQDIFKPGKGLCAPAAQ